jgi:hypothetical protein
MVVDAEILHAATLGGLEPGVADMQRIDFAAETGQAVREGGVY